MRPDEAGRSKRFARENPATNQAEMSVKVNGLSFTFPLPGWLYPYLVIIPQKQADWTISATASNRVNGQRSGNFALCRAPFRAYPRAV